MFSLVPTIWNDTKSKTLLDCTYGRLQTACNRRKCNTILIVWLKSSTISLYERILKVTELATLRDYSKQLQTATNSLNSCWQGICDIILNYGQDRFIYRLYRMITCRNALFECSLLRNCKTGFRKAILKHLYFCVNSTPLLCVASSKLRLFSYKYDTLVIKHIKVSIIASSIIYDKSSAVVCDGWFMSHSVIGARI